MRPNDRIKSHLIGVFSTVFVLFAGSTIYAAIDQKWFGEAQDVEFAADLWSSMQQAGLLEISARESGPRVGVHPHGAWLESYKHTVAVNGTDSTVVIKFSYRGFGASYEAISENRDAYLEDITVMFKREAGYDTQNQDWFYAKYEADGSLDVTPNGVPLAGRIAKGKPKGCIFCHRKAIDYLYAF